MDLRCNDSIADLVEASDLADVAACQAELVRVTRLRGTLDAHEAAVVRRLDALAADEPAVFPLEIVARATKLSLRQADRLGERARACVDLPELAAVLAEGSASGAHIDTLVNAMRGLTDFQKAAVAQQAPRLASAAATQTRSQFEQTAKQVVRAIVRGDGLALAARQRRESRLHHGIDPITGMWWFRGQLDPASGAEVEGRLRSTIERLFHDATPDTCPAGDPFAKQSHLAALALVAMVKGDAGQASGPDVSVLIDERTLREGHEHEGTICDVGLGRFGLPVETIRRWACVGTVTPVIVAADGSRLLLGRETRLANRVQRRALRVLYRSCALCEVPFDHCEIHHVSWFRLGGLTDVDNLLPLCSQHHHLAHEGGWALHLAPDRTLTVARPGGVISTHGPPRVTAA